MLSHSVVTPCDPMDCSSPGSSVHRGVSRQEYWSGLPCPSPGDLPNPGIEHKPPALQVDSLPTEPPCRDLDLPFLTELLPPILPDPSLGATEGRGGEGSEIASVPLLPGAQWWLQCPERDRKPCSVDSQPSGTAPTLLPDRHPLPGLHSLTS